MKYIINVLLSTLIFSACKNKVANKTQRNVYPIEFIGYKILKFNKPLILSKGGLPIDKDTSFLYSLSNSSSDTIWVQTQRERYDSLWPGFKDPTIKMVCANHTLYRKIPDGAWLMSTDGNCWGGHDSIQLFPNQKFYFINGSKRSMPNYDSIKYDIFIKIKKNGTIKDSSVTKKLVLKGDHFIEDVNQWNL
jgi:hypothetical protein